jgi:hypothetical protein
LQARGAASAGGGGGGGGLRACSASPTVKFPPRGVPTWRAEIGKFAAIAVYADRGSTSTRHTVRQRTESALGTSLRAGGWVWEWVKRRRRRQGRAAGGEAEALARPTPASSPGQITPGCPVPQPQKALGSSREVGDLGQAVAGAQHLVLLEGCGARRGGGVWGVWGWGVPARRC